MPSVNPIEFSREPSELYDKEISAVKRVLSSPQWILGPHVELFESTWASYTDNAFCVGTANGYDAIYIGLKSLGISYGDEVITTSLTAFATTLAIVNLGAIPVFADIDPDTCCITASSISSCVTSRTKAVVIVHLYGQSADILPILDLCDHSNLFLVEDCAQAHGSRYNSKSVGSFGVFSAWSFYPTKNLGTVGDAGALTTSDPELASVATSLRNYGQTDRYNHSLIGINSRLDELQAAILLARFPYLDTWINARRSIAKKYSIGIQNPLVLPLPLSDNLLTHVFHQYVIRSPFRDALLNHLKHHDITTIIHYPIPSHQQHALTGLIPSGISLPNTEAHCSSCLSLPIHPYLTDSEVAYVIKCINAFDV